ncbi:hypothetical protein J7M07_06740 [bacterium]|nr:hypothetical protein [bacterium]
MKTRIKKLKRIAGYYNQKKKMKVIELVKARNERYRKEKAADIIKLEKREHIEVCVDILSGRLDTSVFKRLDGDFQYFRGSLERANKALEKAIEIEKERREDVVTSTITERKWNNIVSRKEKDFNKSQGIKREKSADDISLIRFRP